MLNNSRFMMALLRRKERLWEYLSLSLLPLPFLPPTLIEHKVLGKCFATEPWFQTSLFVLRQGLTMLPRPDLTL